MRKRTKFLTLLILSLVISTLLAACGDRGKQTGGELPFKSEIFFVGSSSMAPVISQLADQFTNQFRTWDQVDPGLPAAEIKISVATGGSGAGAKAVLDGTADFGMLARDTREEERGALANYREIKIGMDALVIAVKQDNPLARQRRDIGAAELRQIFAGEISRWNELDPALPAKEIVLLVRDVGGGAHEVFQKAIMGKSDFSDRAVQVHSMPSLVSRLAGNRQAIGYASYGVADQFREELAVFSLDGVVPSAENIMNGSYPVARPLVLVWNGELSAAEQAFLDYIRSPAGARVITEMGFLPLP
ncbi:MAG TPA: phosphate ABC transporter substrate-binding protein [Desulfurivibrio alkaliphilus]|uniref:Phosphate ABC transporter substrate-binding protein n=1 Tax=Desulfurivibrio alkaliphilus TaxID=427923 RepID=A0A7C2TLD5_9BACT|nr:phosphate ABC transporter substrate-binding protein [Desulfurivibrio alkaliphilus]